MRETHPIDELFGRALRQAAVAPPPALGAAILARAQRRRKGLMWWWGSGAAVLLALIGFTYSLQRDSATGSNDAAPTVQLGEHAATEEMGSVDTVKAIGSGASAVTDRAGLKPDLAASDVNKRPAAEEVRMFDHVSTSVLGARPQREVVMAPSMAHRDASSVQGRSAVQSRAVVGGSEEIGGEGRPVNDQAEAQQRASLVMLQIRQNSDAPPPQPEPRAVAQPDYYRPRGYWWFGPSATLQFSRNRWTGQPARLVAALEGNGRSSAGGALGVMAVRAWPSGFSIGIGVEADRWRQEFRNIERRQFVETTTMVTQMVTLNAQVIFQEIDTVSTVTNGHVVAEGADVRTRLRVPVEVAWGHRLGRWRVGVRSGMVAERTWIRSSASLVVDPADGFVRARSLEARALQARYPFSLSAIAGLDAGFSITERTGLTATPFMTIPISTFGPDTDVSSAPHRAGLRLMLQHRF